MGRLAPKRNAKGQYEKGSTGNPDGARRKKPKPSLEQQLQAAMDELVQQLMAKIPEMSGRDAMHALKFLVTDRGLSLMSKRQPERTEL
ncbi:MAG TPA: hypothetical protein VFS41_05915, partial [Edaphobacter sp.]|nr:hypothetical protein [Edaphobacter sp.]